jgi:hypothetical protein
MSAATNGSQVRGANMAVGLSAQCHPELKRLAATAADKANVPLSEIVVRALAAYLKRPDLSVVPRKPTGRRRKAIPA